MVCDLAKPRARDGPALVMGLAADRRRLDAAPGLALLIGLVAAATIVTVWALDHAGYVPCELCLAERNPYYIAVPLALLTAGCARGETLRVAQGGFVLLGILFLGGAGLAAYHAGVEWQVWAGPTGCSGPTGSPGSVADFLQQLKTVKVVRCDAPALVVAGLSLAGWNVLMSLLLCALAVQGARITGRASS